MYWEKKRKKKKKTRKKKVPNHDWDLGTSDTA
jgi:hypothetical protein